MKLVSFTIPGEPVAKARPRVGKFGAYTPKKTINYESLVVTEYERQCDDYRFPDGVPLRLTVRMYKSIAKSASKKERAAKLTGEIRPTNKPDWDNVGKIVSDALNQVAYADDSAICDAHVLKYYSDVPRVEVDISDIVL